VVIRNCGNGFFEQERGEACDDGNVASGDGCSSFCQVEPGWICVGNTVCVKLDDERVKLFCGNGKVEREYGEVCDDGNSVSGDGCSQNCKVENGWACRILSKM
jgi:cysteine-rich repeat protein